MTGPSSAEQDNTGAMEVVVTNKSKNHFGKQEKLVRKESHGKQHQPEAFKNNRNARLEASLNATARAAVATVRLARAMAGLNASRPVLSTIGSSGVCASTTMEKSND